MAGAGALGAATGAGSGVTGGCGRRGGFRLGYGGRGVLSGGFRRGNGGRGGFWGRLGSRGRSFQSSGQCINGLEKRRFG